MPTTTRQAIPYPAQTDASELFTGTHWPNMSAVADDKYILRFSNASARNAAMPTPAEGVLAFLTQEDVLTLYTGAAWIRLESAKGVLKPANETTTSATVQSDDSLSFSVAANATYVYKLWVTYTSTTFSVNWMNSNWTVPTGAVMLKGLTAGGFNSSNAQAGLANLEQLPATSGRVVGSNGSPSPCSYHESGTLVSSSTPGTAQWLFARGSSAANVTVGAGSHLEVWRVS